MGQGANWPAGKSNPSLAAGPGTGPLLAAVAGIDWSGASLVEPDGLARPWSSKRRGSGKGRTTRAQASGAVAARWRTPAWARAPLTRLSTSGGTSSTRW